MRALCEADSPDDGSPGCFASLHSVQGAGLACRLGQRFKALHALRSPPEPRTPLRRLCGYPCPLWMGNNLFTQTVSHPKPKTQHANFTACPKDRRYFLSANKGGIYDANNRARFYEQRNAKLLTPKKITRSVLRRVIFFDFTDGE